MNLFIRCTGGGIAASLILLFASAQIVEAKPASMSKKPIRKAVVAKAPKCKRCMMTLSTKKTAATPDAVKVNGKTYYCCKGCAVTSPKTKTAKKATVKLAKADSIPFCPKCNMQMIASPTLFKKTAIKVNSKTYYCCTICPRH